MPWNDNLDHNSPTFGIASDPNLRIRTIAGPGTGKSFSTRRRVARLLEEGADPSRILAVTFTRIAAEDIRRELHALGIDGAEGIQARTLHGLAMRILRRGHVMEQLGRETRPLTTFETEPMLHDLDVTHGNKRTRAKRLKAYESAFAINQDDDPLVCEDQSDRAFRLDLVRWLEFHRAMLIGELIPFLYLYLRDNPTCPERFEFHHILADEFQDLNKVEQSVIRLLGENALQLIVGDDNQSIYSFKHAHPEGISEWEQGNPNRADYALTECYRCPRRVVSMANNVIAHNQAGLAGQLVPRLANGEGLFHSVQFQTSEQEADGISANIVQKVEAGTDPGDILVLTPRKILGMKIADRLREANVPCREYLSESALETAEVTEKLAILMVTADRDDRPALRWLLGMNHPTYRASQYRRLRELCELTGMTPWVALEAVGSGQLDLQHCGTLLERFIAIRAQVEGIAALDNARQVVDMLFPEDQSEFSRIRALLDDDIDEETSISEARGLVIEKIYEPDFPADAEYVRVMTLYGSKGLGTPIVYITSLIDGLLPRRSDPEDTPAERLRKLEEQRRLFYVALTRVKTDLDKGLPGELILSNFRQFGFDEAHKLNGGNASAIASRFFAELGPDAADPTAN